MSEAFLHQPVMVDEVVDLMRAVPPGVVIDATVGAGGHARALLEARPDLHLVGLDRDGDAIAAATEALADFAGRVVLRRARFDEITTTLQQLGQEMGERGDISGALFDLGVSSPQLDRPARGFSYRDDGPLDMRMDTREPLTAGGVVNDYREDELARVLYEHGGERFARRLARAIVAARPLATTGELVEVIRATIPAPARRRGGHPAKRTFQAIRIEVNGELHLLPGALDQAIDVLMPGGRCAVLAYHSGEDRLVKQRFVHAATGGCTCPPGLPCACGAVPSVRLLGRRARRPSVAEVARNRRSESARLRACEKLPLPHGEPGPGGDAA
jgi:16S rRNA (cytosine1402-N4)-methyltransferase